MRLCVYVYCRVLGGGGFSSVRCPCTRTPRERLHSITDCRTERIIFDEREEGEDEEGLALPS
jgi:hypothetical protein